MVLFYREAWWAALVLEETLTTMPWRISFHPSSKQLLLVIFFILRIHTTVNEATAYAEMALLWDAGVNGKKLCWKKDVTHSDKAKTQQSYWIWRYLIPWSFFDKHMKV